MRELNGLTSWYGMAVFALCLLPVYGESTAPRVNWVDRSIMDTQVATQSPIDNSFERFWNLPKPVVEKAEDFDQRRGAPPHPATSLKTQTLSMNQKRDKRQRRSFIGINLFNLIPLIDIVHGDVIEESVDHVEGRKK